MRGASGVACETSEFEGGVDLGSLSAASVCSGLAQRRLNVDPVSVAVDVEGRASGITGRAVGSLLRGGLP